MSKVIMKKADWIDNPSWCDPVFNIDYFTESQIRNRFWPDKSWEYVHIPKELRDRGWEPDESKMYKCWWYQTNPSDPGDSGEYILLYIEELDGDEEVRIIKDEYIKLLDEILGRCSIGKLKDIYKTLKRY